MKELIALVVASALAMFFLGLYVLQRLEPWSLALLLAVAIGAGMAIENYDTIAKFDAFGRDKARSVQIQDESIKKVRDEGIQQIRKETDAQRAALAEEVRNINEALTSSQQVLSDLHRESHFYSNVLGAQSDLKTSLAQDMRKINEGLTNSKKVLADLQQQSDFYSTVLAAEADDRHAFDKLKAWSEDQNYAFAQRARAAWSAIAKSHNFPMFESVTLSWHAGVDPSKFSLSELENMYASAQNESKPALMEYIAVKRSDLPLLARDQFLINVMRNDGSLSAVTYAGVYFSQINNIHKTVPLATDYYEKWFNDNRESIR
jgi:Skp family chaperone for outer membrane proteins